MGSRATVSAPILEVENGALLGARNVEVGGLLYDVRFVDGACSSLFTECGAGAGQGFAFTTDAQADAASRALFDQVVVPIYFEGEPEVTSIDGCAVGNQVLTWLDCYLVTPFATAQGAFNARSVFLSSNPSEIISNGAFSRPVDAVAPDFTFAAWRGTDPAVGVPIGGTFALFVAGLLAVAWRRSKVVPGCSTLSTRRR